MTPLRLVSSRLTPADIFGRKLVNAMHVDYAKGHHAWLGNVDGIDRLSVATGADRAGPFRRWYVDQKPVRDLEAALAVINGEMTLEHAMQSERPKKVSLKSQIAEVDRELAMRAEVYPRQVAGRGMRQAEADLKMAHLQAVRDTLSWLQDNEAMIKQRLSY